MSIESELIGCNINEDKVKDLVENKVINEMSNVNFKNLITSIHDDLKELYMFFTDNDMKEFSLLQVKETLVNFKESFQQDLRNYNCNDINLEFQILSKLADIESSIVVMTQSLNKSFKLKCILHDAFSKNLLKLADVIVDVDAMYCKCDNKLKTDLKFFRNSTNYLINLRENELRKKKEEINKLSKVLNNEAEIRSTSDIDDLDENVMRILLKKNIIHKEMLDLEDDISNILSHNTSHEIKDTIDKKLMGTEIINLKSENFKLKSKVTELEKQNLEVRNKLIEHHNFMEKSLDFTRKFHIEQLKLMQEDQSMDTEA